jgi:FkbH-like protein
MINFSKIKLIIWDLDETFWNGTISEDKVEHIEENLVLIKKLTENGIINSICSKNDYAVCEDKLKKLGVYDLFVFNSIDWSPKGPRIAEIVKNINLRAENILFIDDNIVNLEESKFYLPQINTALPDIIPDLIEYANRLLDSDLDQNRLKRYRILQKKHYVSKKFNSNEEFLYSSEIKVELNYKVYNKLDRIYELVQRTNQLNFTKKRSSKEDLIKLFESEAKCGFVSVTDKFGDYGIVGFFAVLDNKLVHFVFSCRTIGQGVEQYVYGVLNFPDISVVGDVANPIVKGKYADWINNNNQSKTPDKNISIDNIKILFKGPCDMSRFLYYINTKTIDEESSYMSIKKNNFIEHHNHSEHIRNLITLSNSIKKDIINECHFMDDDAFQSNILTKNYDFIFLSTLIESNLGVYKQKKEGYFIPFGEYFHPITNKNNWDGYRDGTIFNSQNEFNVDFLENFSNKYTFTGRITAERFIENIEVILNNIYNKTKIVLILGSELEFNGEKNKNYMDRHNVHKDFNKAVKSHFANNERIHFVELNEFILNQNQYTNSINHFTRKTYFDVSNKLIKLIKDNTEVEFKTHSKFIFVFDYIKYLIKNSLNNHNSKLYNHLRKKYRFIKSKL